MGRPSKRRLHPLLIGQDPAVFVPEAAGVVRGYPRTAEAFNRQYTALRANIAKAKAAGRLTRRGVPNGWAGRRDEVYETRRNSHTLAERLTEALVPIEVNGGDDPRAALLLAAMAEIALCPTYAAGERTAAARTFLAYTVSPASRVVRAAGGPLAYLAKLASDVTKAASDMEAPATATPAINDEEMLPQNDRVRERNSK